LRVLRDEKTIVRARELAEELLADDPTLSGHPLLAQAVAAVEQSAASEYIEKG
jgi:ATP-dependent DNA helicase RecG